MSEVFDIAESRRSLQMRRSELLAECDANSKLQKRFDAIAAQLSKKYIAPVRAEELDHSDDEDKDDKDEPFFPPSPPPPAAKDVKRFGRSNKDPLQGIDDIEADLALRRPSKKAPRKPADKK